jgi:hypothetical protein
VIDDRLWRAVAAGSRRAGTHAMRAVAEAISAVAAFADEVIKAFDAEDGPEHIDVEPGEGE